MTTALSVHALTKVYGRVRALDGLDLDLEPGDVYKRQVKLTGRSPNPVRSNRARARRPS